MQSFKYVSVPVSPLQAEFVNVRYLLFRQPVTLQIPAMLQVCSCGLVVILTDREKMFDIPITLKEVYHISDIREVGSSGVCSSIKIQHILDVKCSHQNYVMGLPAYYMH